AMHPTAKKMLAEIRDAANRPAAVHAINAFAHEFGAKWPKAVAKIVDDAERLLTFFDYPAEHWVHLKTTNPIESTFSTVRLCAKRSWVTAAMWMAWLRVRLPRRESRQTLRPPEETSIGAVPLKAAKRSRVGNQAMSPVTPTTVAATTGPTPKMSMTVVPDAATTCWSRFFDLVI